VLARPKKILGGQGTKLLNVEETAISACSPSGDAVRVTHESDKVQSRPENLVASNAGR